MALFGDSESSDLLVNEITNNIGGIDNEKQSRGLTSQTTHRTQQPYHIFQPERQFDVRMKRHPELQPYVPSERDKFTSGSKKQQGNLAGSSNGGPRSNIRQLRNVHPSVNSGDNRSTSPSVKPKKCVSMTRLDQLAQPKRIFTKVNKKPNQESTKTITKTSSNVTTTKVANIKSKISSSVPPKSILSHKPQSNQIPPTRKSLIDSPQDASVTQTSLGHCNLEENPELIQVPTSPIPSPPTSPSTTPSYTPSFNLSNTPSMTTSAAPSTTVSNSTSNETSNSPSTTTSMTASLSSGKLREDEEARFKAEEELKEIARRQEEERRSRQSTVESILSKFNKSQ